jgi:hypothetical protein
VTKCGFGTACSGDRVYNHKSSTFAQPSDETFCHRRESCLLRGESIFSSFLQLFALIRDNRETGFKPFSSYSLGHFERYDDVRHAAAVDGKGFLKRSDEPTKNSISLSLKKMKSKVNKMMDLQQKATQRR